MLFLAGLMGLMAVGSVAFVEVYGTEEEEDEIPNPTEALTDEFLTENSNDPTQTASGSPGETIVGTDADDVLAGSDGDDEIGGYAGDDQLNGGPGNDDQHGGGGEDTQKGGSGNDSLHGDGGDDIVEGGDGDDVLFGHEDNDVLRGGAGNDALTGSGGQDLLSGEADNDALQGSLGDDTLDGGHGEDSLFGGWGTDLINGIESDSSTDTDAPEDSRDFLNGGGGNDTIFAGNDDIVTAGSGEDLIVVGDWIEGDRAAEVMDFDPQEDSLLLVWDDTASAAEAPDVSVAPDPENNDQMQVHVGDAIVALVNGRSLFAADLSLIPLSSAIVSGLTDA